MKENTGVCPGCRKGCSADAPRCKYGKMYFAQNNSVQDYYPIENRPVHEAPFEYGKKRKWEKRVDREGLAWRFLMVGRGMKKMLLDGKIVEEDLFEDLNNSEKQVLSVVLEKLGRRIYCR